MQQNSPASLPVDQNPHGDGRYIPIIDGWRAIAIVLVLAFHGIYHSELTGYPRLQTLNILTGRTGALGVLVFFCISGYLITQRLLVESRKRGMFSVSEFYIKRAFRILPPLAAYLLVVLALFLAGVLPLQVRDWSAPLFLANYFQGSWYTSHFWSLSVEEHFYLFWPFCVVFVGWRRAMWVGGALICAIAVWRPWELHHVTNPAAALQHTDMRIDYIMMGAVVALATEFYPWTIHALRRMGSGLGLTVLLLLLLASSLRAPVDLRSVQAILITLVVCSSSIANAPIPRLLLASRPVLFLGKISYSLYIWQQLFLGTVPNPFWNSPLVLPVKYLACLLAAYGSYQFIEKPFIRYGRALLERRKLKVLVT